MFYIVLYLFRFATQLQNLVNSDWTWKGHEPVSGHSRAKYGNNWQVVCCKCFWLDLTWLDLTFAIFHGVQLWTLNIINKGLTITFNTYAFKPYFSSKSAHPPDSYPPGTLILFDSVMSDLSDHSQIWWESILKAIKQWYASHLELTPLERVEHRPELPEEIRGPRFSRLEKRATHLLMQAIPVHQQEEVIAGKDVNVLSILGRLMLCYQPGGLSEKSAILTALDSPEEAQNLSQAVGGLRKWLRWHRRAGEVGVVRPDATLQAKGLGRLMKKVLKDNQDLGFRVALAKSSLQIDTTPNESSIMKFAHHMLAEVEQIAHQDRKKEQSSGSEVKAKRFEDGGRKDGAERRKRRKGWEGWEGRWWLAVQVLFEWRRMQEG